ncbi:Unknown protein [Striga hermonthica]|uniref:DUF4283 domain-containing protein n=1 Tax=Striga hermonthica TaxID=68872 RepID=A0A9N7MV73_STRHE|nr:Unknown protein [Striga hermonthica]
MGDDLADKLQQFKLSGREADGVELSDKDIALGLRECQLSLIGKCFGEKKVNFNGLLTTLGNIWFTRKPFHIKNMGINKFQFLFQSEEDRDKILKGKAWSFEGQYIVLNKWDPRSLEIIEEEEVVRLWVQIQNLPLHWTTADSGLKIGRKIGKVIDVQAPGIGNTVEQNIRVLVELKLREPIL